MAEIDAVLIETASQIESRITATRVLLLGAIGLVFRKQTRTAFVSVRDRDGEWVFGIEGTDPMALWSRLLGVSARYPAKFGARPGEGPTRQTTPAAAAPVVGIKERLVRLEGLRADGLIDDAEFATRRAAILAET